MESPCTTNSGCFEAATDTVQLIAGAKPEDRYDARLLEDRLTAFMSGGLRAPLAGKVSVKKAA